MFNRSTKLTALLVAAASIASSVPAMASTKLDTKEGTIYNAVSFKDGKYLFEGYKKDDNDKGLYYNNGKDDKALEVDDDIVDEITTKFGKDKVAVKDGDDDYVVELQSGKIDEDADTRKDLEDNAKTNLKSKLRKTDRYGEDVEINEFNCVTDGRLQDTWYQYGTTSGFFGYVNGSKNYIDCSYDLNAYVFYTETTTGTEGKMYKIEDVEDTEKINKDVTIKVKEGTQPTLVRYLGQDDKYIYSLIKVEFENAKDVKDGNEVETRHFVQKVSKAQGEKKEGAYKPKSTECFELTGNSSVGDVDKAYEVLVGEDEISNAQYFVANGSVYAVGLDKDDNEKVKVFKFDLKTNEKLKVNNKKSATAKVNGHVVKKDADKDHDIEESNRSFCIDVNGNVWVINKGKILKSTKAGDFEEKYTCDRSLDCIDVYDDNNLIAWNEDGEVYTTATEGAQEAVVDAEVKTGWQEDKATGVKTLYGADGKQLFGWQQVGADWFYLNPVTGAMQTGWVQSPASGLWYYMDALSGAMLSNTTVDGYVLGADGAWIQ